MRELRTTASLILTVAPTGAFHGKEANPNLPVEPEEVAQAIRQAWNEGASIAHVHARDPQKGTPTSDPAVFRRITELVRAGGCDIILQHSTAADYAPRLDPARGLPSLEFRPEMASLGISLTRLVAFRGQESVRVVTLADVEFGARVMRERGVKPELEIFNPVLVEDLHALIEKDLLVKPCWCSLVMGMRRINRAYMSYSPRTLLQLVDTLPEGCLFSVLGIGADELPATTQSILLGGHVRVGFEDNVYYRRGEPAGSNAQLTARAARLGRELGCEIASPAEARRLLGIPPLSTR